MYDPTLNDAERRFITNHPDAASQLLLTQFFEAVADIRSFTDSQAIIKFNQHSINALHGPYGSKLNGVEFSSDEFTPVINHELQALESPLPEPQTLEQQEQSAGLIIVEPDNRVWLYSPRNFHLGYCFSFPKGQTLAKGADGRNSPQTTALTEAHEETGLNVKIVALQGDYDRGNGRMCRVYIGVRTGGSPFAWKGTAFQPIQPGSHTGREETAAVWLAPAERLIQLAALSLPTFRNGTPKPNPDIPVLQDAFTLLKLAAVKGSSPAEGLQALTAECVATTGYADLRPHFLKQHPSSAMDYAPTL